MEASPTGITFREASVEYLRYVEDVRQSDAKTVRDYRGVVERYLLDEFGDTATLSNRTILRHLTVLHGIFRRAKRAYGLKENPASAELVERPRVVYSGEFDTFDRYEVEQLSVAATSPQDAALYRVAAFTGLRTGELFALRWADVDFVAGLLHVRRNYTGTPPREKVPKGKRVRSVPMMPDVIDSLAALKDREHFTGDTDLVFCSEVGAHLDYFEHLKRYKAALKRAGLREIRFHDLRHAFGTAAITKLDPYAVRATWATSTTRPPSAISNKPRREDAALLAEAFGVSESTDQMQVAEAPAE